MATYEIKLDADTGVTYITVDGAIVADEWVEFMQSEGFSNRTERVFCDMTKATLTAIETQALISLAQKAKSFVRPGVRAAYLLNKGVDFGIANMFKVYSDQMKYGVALEPFTDREIALKWLLNEDLKSS